MPLDGPKKFSLTPRKPLDWSMKDDGSDKDHVVHVRCYGVFYAADEQGGKTLTNQYDHNKAILQFSPLYNIGGSAPDFPKHEWFKYSLVLLSLWSWGEPNINQYIVTIHFGGQDARIAFYSGSNFVQTITLAQAETHTIVEDVPPLRTPLHLPPLPSPPTSIYEKSPKTLKEPQPVYWSFFLIGDANSYLEFRKFDVQIR